MNNFGRQALVIGAQPNLYVTGVGWEYITIINESGFMCSLNFSGCGSMDFPAWFKDDIPIADGYTGQLTITPTNISSISTAAMPSAIITVNGWTPGELTTPQGVALTRLTNVGNVVPVSGGTATAVQQDNTAGSNTILEATPSGGSSSFINCNGTATMQGAWHFTSAVTIDGGANINLLTAETGNDLAFHVGAANRTVDTVNGVDTWEVNSSGAELLTGTLDLNKTGLTLTPTTQTLTTGATVSLGGSCCVFVSEAAAVTGIIMPLGSPDGQIVLLVNLSNFLITFAAAATSHVFGGTAVTINAGRNLFLV